MDWTLIAAWALGVACCAGALTEAVKRAAPDVGAVQRLLPLISLAAGAVAACVPWSWLSLELGQRVGLGALAGSQAAWAYQAVSRALRQRARDAGLPVAADSGETAATGEVRK